MATTLPPNRSRRHYGGPGALVQQFSHATGLSVGSASQAIYGNDNLRVRLLEWIRICQRAGRQVVLERYMRPILEAYHRRTATPYSPKLVLEQAEADSAEDRAQAHFQQEAGGALDLRHVSDAALAEYRRAIEKEAIADLALVYVLAAEERRRRSP